MKARPSFVMKIAKNPAIPDTAVTKIGMMIFHDTPESKTSPAKIATKTKAVPKSLCRASKPKTGSVKIIIHSIKRKSKGIVRSLSLCFCVN